MHRPAKRLPAILRRAAFVLLFAALASPVVWGQAPTGVISGTVVDKTQSVIPGVKVQARSKSTGLVREARSNENGRYRFDLLPAGEYELTVEAQGFAKTFMPNITVKIGETASVDIVLQVGSITETVEVGAEVPLVQSENAEVGAVIEQRRVETLPLNARKFMQLALLTGGVSTETGGIFALQGSLTSPAVSINGQRQIQNNIRLDGVINQSPSFQVMSISPTIDSIQEFRVLVNNYGADKGLYAGQISVATRSGSNEFHGTVFEFFRNDVLDARNFFDAEKLPFRQNQFGFTSGGPIVKNKVYFFGGYEGFRRRKGLTRLTTVPTVRMHAGDFSELSGSIVDPLTGMPFPGNVIPSNRFSSVGRVLLDLYPLPNTPGLTANFIVNGKQVRDEDLFNVRVDANLSRDATLFARFTMEQVDQVEPFGGISVISSQPFLPGFGLTGDARGTNTAVRFNYVFGPQFANQLTFGHLYFEGDLGHQNRSDFAQENGIQGTNRDDPALFGIPLIVTASQGLVGDPIANFGTRGDHLFQLSDDVSYISGNHSLKFGAEIIYWRLATFSSFLDRGVLAFLGRHSRNDVADLLLGFPSLGIVARGVPATHLRRTTWHFYFADTWKVTRTVTLDVGVRYEYNPPYVETDNRLVLFDSDFPGGRIILPGNRLEEPFLATLADALIAQGRLAFASDLGLPKTLIEANKFEFAPRVGLAWAPREGTVFRAGYGIFYSQPPSSNVGGFVQGAPFWASFFRGFAAPTPVETALLAAGTGAPSGSNFLYPEMSPTTPYMQQWNLDIQNQVGKTFMFEAAYLGNKGTHLDRVLSLNPWQAGTTPFASRARFPLFGDLKSFGSSTGSSSYHALMLKSQWRYSHGLTFESAYTFSKAIDDSSNTFIQEAGSRSPNDPNNLDAEKALANFHQRHRFVLSYVYELPFGPKRFFLSEPRSSFAQKLLEGWNISGIVTLASGHPFTANLLTNISGRPDVDPDRPNLLGDPNLPASQRTPERWFDTSMFVIPPPGTFGNAGRNILIGPGTTNVDFAIHKRTTFGGESRALEFRAEFFNIFNHPNFNLPDRFVESATFGRILSARDPRDVQFGLKFTF